MDSGLGTRQADRKNQYSSVHTEWLGLGRVGEGSGNCHRTILFMIMIQDIILFLLHKRILKLCSHSTSLITSRDPRKLMEYVKYTEYLHPFPLQATPLHNVTLKEILKDWRTSRMNLKIFWSWLWNKTCWSCYFRCCTKFFGNERLECAKSFIPSRQ